MNAVPGDVDAYCEKVGSDSDGGISLEEVCRLTGLVVEPAAIESGRYGAPFRLDAEGNPVPTEEA